MHKEEEFCKCDKPVIYAKDGEWGYQEYCDVCKKKMEDGFHYYNHYDGEDLDDADLV